MGYEDPDSLKFKTDFIKANGYGGGMVWSTDMDDFRNMCGHGANPMLRVIYEELKDYIVPPSPTRPPTTKVRTGCNPAHQYRVYRRPPPRYVPGTTPPTTKVRTTYRMYRRPPPRYIRTGCTAAYQYRVYPAAHHQCTTWTRTYHQGAPQPSSCPWGQGTLFLKLWTFTYARFVPSVLRTYIITK